MKLSVAFSRTAGSILAILAVLCAIFQGLVASMAGLVAPFWSLEHVEFVIFFLVAAGTSALTLMKREGLAVITSTALAFGAWMQWWFLDAASISRWNDFRWLVLPAIVLEFAAIGRWVIAMYLRGNVTATI